MERIHLAQRLFIRISATIAIICVISIATIALLTLKIESADVNADPTYIDLSQTEAYTEKTTPTTKESKQELVISEGYTTPTYAGEFIEESLVRGPQKKHLTARNGVFHGPSGRETYYNLPMGGVIKYMRHLGYSKEEYPYWIRDDGCKMLGPYIMVAANLKIRPKGTILETSLGTAIVCDTGGFVKKYPKGIDIAVNW